MNSAFAGSWLNTSNGFMAFPCDNVSDSPDVNLKGTSSFTYNIAGAANAMVLQNGT